MSSTEEGIKQMPPEEMAPPAHSGPKAHATPRRARYRRAAIVAGVAIAAVLALGLLAQSGAGRPEDSVPTAAVERGDLNVYVTQVGALWSTDPLDIKDEVEGSTMILEIVDEGALITPEDVDNGKVLVRLDSANLEEREADRSISYLKAEASFTQAKERLEIQKKQNESDIAQAELDVKFARMELERYLGSELAARALEDREALAVLAEDERLGGAAQQALRNYSARVQLTTEELARATNTLDWTTKLHEKGYVSSEDLTADRLAVTRSKIQVEAAQEELSLFKRYTLVKEAETKYSDFVEMLRELDRVNAKGRSELAQAEANLRSKEGSLKLQKDQLDKTRDMIAKCTIRAPKPGRVTYGNSADPWQRSNNPIRAGVSVQENQTLLQIPDLSNLAVRMNVPEVHKDKLRPGQPALITLEAVPGETYVGHVSRISPMASAAQARLNPDKKVYQTDVALDEAPPGFIPGMSATAQIIVAQLKDVLHVPAQAVTTHKGLSFCWVKTADGRKLQQVTAGLSSDKHVEVKEGLHAGELVYLAPPDQQSHEQLLKEVAALEEARGPAEAAAEPAPPEMPQEAPWAAVPQPAPVAEGQPQPAAGGSVDWRALGTEMRNAQTDEERQKVMEKFTANMTPEERKQFQERMQAGRSMSPEDRARRRQQYGAGGGEGGGAGAEGGPPGGPERAGGRRGGGAGGGGPRGAGGQAPPGP